MGILFLGTCAAEGWPGIFCECEYCKKARKLKGKNIRTRSSILIDKKYKVDFPPDTYLHVLKYGINLAEVEHLFITHSHRDHFSPTELIFRSKPFAHMKEGRVLNIYGSKTVCEIINDLILKKTNYNTLIKLHQVKVFNEFKAGEMVVFPILADHKTEIEDEECFNFIFNYKNKFILFGCDTGWYPEETWQYLKNFKFDIIIMDCTNGKLPYEKGHLGIEGVFKVKKKLMEENLLKENFKFIVTHFSHNGGLLYSELKEIFRKEKIEVAYDGKIVKI